MKGTCEQIPFHFFLKFMMLRRAGGLFVLQSSVFRINEKLLNGEQGLALTRKSPDNTSLGDESYKSIQ